MFTAKSRRGKVLLESELERLGIVCKHSTAYHPQTCRKVERFHQTLKRFLAKQTPTRSLPELQRQLDTFRAYHNQRRHTAPSAAAPPWWPSLPVSRPVPPAPSQPLTSASVTTASTPTGA